MSRDTVALNPLQCDDTPENRAHLHGWLRQIAGVDDDAAYAVATRAVEAIFRRPRLDRSLVGRLRVGIRSRLRHEKGPGEVGWRRARTANWFNGARDSLDLTARRAWSPSK